MTIGAGERCSVWAADAQVDPIGSSGSHRGYLLLEWPTPWPHDVGSTPALAPLRDELAAAGVRLQLIAAAGGRGELTSTGPGLRAILYRRPEGPGFTRFTSSSSYVRADDVVAGARSLLAGSGASDPSAVDVLVCTHGSRDVCCGSAGTRLVQELVQSGRFDVGGLRLWRTSHLGGHRFAPTALVLPTGTSWAYLTVADLLAVVDRDRPPTPALLARYRGCSGLPTPASQALERAVLQHLGWEVLDAERRVVDSGTDRVRIELHRAGVDAGAWEGLVVPGRSLPVPTCREVLDGRERLEDELVVAALRSVPPGRS